MNDPALTAVARRLLFIENQLQALRADVSETNVRRSAAPARTPRTESPAPPESQPPLESAPQPVPVSEKPPQHADEPPPQPGFEARTNRQPSFVKPVPSAPPARTSTGTIETLLSGRGLAVAGALLILVGCAYFLDLSFTRGWIGPAERIALGVVAGFGLIAASARFLRGAYRIAAEGAAGLGAGITYLSSWAAIAVFPDLHIPRAAAFATMAAATCALALLANRARSQPIALMGLIGAYLTPILLASAAPDRVLLAIYLLIVTSGMLVLARRRSFAAVEATAVVAALVYTLAFIPDPVQGWSNAAAASVASAFFLIFGAAFSIRPIANGRAKALQLLPFISVTSVYVLMLEGLFNANQTLLGATLAGLAGLLFGAPRIIKQIPSELQSTYRCLGLFAGNLALRSLLHRTELFDAFSIEAAVLVIFGARISNPNVTRLGLAFFAIAAAGLLCEAVTTPPTHTLFTPLIFAFAIWVQSIVTARRAIPSNVRLAFSIGAHAVALAGLTRAGLDATGGNYWSGTLPNLAQLTLSLIWALFAAALFGGGVTTRDSVMRWEALVLFAITIVKVFTVDLSSLDLAYRVLAFIGTGVVFFICSAWYMRSLRPTIAHRAA